MMTSTNNPHTTPSNDKEGLVRRPLQSLNVNSKVQRGVLIGDDTDKITKPKSTINFVTALEVAPSSSAEMSVNQQQSKANADLVSFEDQARSIFREREIVESESRDASETDHEEDMWSLKRASPITEDDESEFMVYESPSKKSKVETIFWDNQLSNDKPFELAAMMNAL